MTRVFAVAAGIVVSVMLGCTTDRPDSARPDASAMEATAPASPASTDSPPAMRAVEIPGLTATLEQYREDEIQDLISVKVTNGSSVPVRVDDLQLQWSGIANTAPLVRSTQLAPGVTFDLRVHEGDASCGDPPQPDRSPPNDTAVAVGDASIDGAAPVLVAIPVEDVRSILPIVYRRSCQEQHVTWSADLRFGDRWEPSTTTTGKPAVRGTIELRRRNSEATLQVTEVNGSVLLRIKSERSSAPVAVLEPGEDEVTIPIVIEHSGTCAAHALIESKKTFIIPIGFKVGNHDTTAYVITFDTPTQQLLNGMITQVCGIG